MQWMFLSLFFHKFIVSTEINIYLSIDHKVVVHDLPHLPNLMISLYITSALSDLESKRSYAQQVEILSEVVFWI